MQNERNRLARRMAAKAAAGAGLLLVWATVAGCSAATEEGSVSEQTDKEPAVAVNEQHEGPPQVPPPVKVDKPDEQSQALLANGFDHAYPIKPAQGERIHGFEAISEDEAVYAISGDNDTTLYQYNLQTGVSDPIGSVPSGSVEMRMTSGNEPVLVVTYWNGERRAYAEWSPAAGGLNKGPKVILARNEKWIVYRSNDAAGLWAASNDGLTGIQLTQYEQDQSPLWIPGTNRFVYVAHTGNTIADGSGYEYALAIYDLDTKQNKLLPLDKGPWMIRGWLEPGKKLLVDHAFNEGESVDYTVPYVVDLTTMKETPLQPEQQGAYNMAFNPAGAAFVMALEGDLLFYDSKAKLAARTPLLAESGEQLQRRFTFSPDGKKGFYTMWVADNSAGGVAVERIIIAEADGSGAYRVNEKGVNISEVEWLSDGKTLAVLVEQDGRLYVAMKRVQ